MEQPKWKIDFYLCENGDDKEVCVSLGETF